MKHKSFQHVVLIGGGTGNSVFFEEFKKIYRKYYGDRDVADDGGSSGRIRSELGMLPPAISATVLLHWQMKKIHGGTYECALYGRVHEKTKFRQYRDRSDE